MIGRTIRSASTRRQGLQWVPIRVALMAPCQHLADFNASTFPLQAKSVERRSWWHGTSQHRSFHSQRPTTGCLGIPSSVPLKPSDGLGKRSCPVLGCVLPQPPSESAEHISSLRFYIQRQQPSNLDRLQLLALNSEVGCFTSAELVFWDSHAE